jgi:hypothetical protein
VFERLLDVAGTLAKYADEARIAGQACEKAYSIAVDQSIHP